MVSLLMVKILGNLSSMIEANDQELCAYLGLSTRYWRKKDEEKAVR